MTPWTAHQASLSIINSQSLLKLMSIESVMPSNHLMLCHPLLLLPSIFPSIRVLSSESVLRIWWPKDWHFSFSISPSNEYSGLISFRIAWFDLLAVQGDTQEFTPKTEIQINGTKQKAQRQIHAPMDTLSSTKEARIYNGEKTISLTSGAGKTGQPLVKE